MSVFQYQDFLSRLNEPEAKATIVQIANQLTPGQVTKPDLEDDQKRWLIVGICLHRIISPALRQYVPPVINKLYNTLKQSDQIHTQTFAKHLKRYKPTNKELNYEAINSNKLQWKKNTKSYNYAVTSDVDFTKLFLITSMAHYTGFDDTCDSSALLNIVINIDKFPQLVQGVAKKVRDDMRNPWAHCNFSEWDVIKYQNSFQMMNQLVRNLQLPLPDEAAILGELTHWQINGVQFLQGTTLGVELVQELKKETEALSRYVLEIASKIDASFKEVHQALESIDGSLTLALDRINKVEQENKTLKLDVVSLDTRLVDLKKDHSDSVKQTEKDVRNVISDINELQLEHKESVDDVRKLEKSVDGIQLDVKNTITELQETKTDIIYTRTDVKNTKVEIENIKKEILDTKTVIDHDKTVLQKTLEDVAANRRDIDEITKYLSSARPKEKIFFYPPDRILTFISREDELEQLQQEFYKLKSDNHVQVICGLGGIGKTTLAVEYSWMFQNFYPGGVFWMSAETNEALEDSLRRLAIDTYNDGKDAKETTIKTLNWLSNLQERWLFVIDNVDMVDIRGSIRELLLGAWKRNSKGHIIITSRREAKEAEEDFRIQSKDCITLDALTMDESIKFLISRSGVQSHKSDDDLEMLAEQLGGLPLALEQAAAHIKSLKSTFKEYSVRFSRKRLKLLKASRSPFEISKERLAVQTTWQLNFDYIAEQSEEEGLGSAAVLVMQIMAFLYADEIPLIILNTGSPKVCNDDLLDSFHDKVGVKQVAEILVRFSLFQHCGDNALNVHRLVQEVIRENLTNVDHKAFILQCATRMVNRALEETQSPRDAIMEENIGRTSLQMWSKIALHANTLKTYLFNFTKACEKQKNICFNIETAKLLQASAVYHSLFQRQDEALACQDQLLSIIPAIGISETDYKDLTCIKIPLLIKDRQIIQCSITMALGTEQTNSADKENAIVLLDPETLRQTGNDAFKMKKYQDAIQCYSEAITASQGNVDTRILTNRSLAYLKICDYENALRDADMCIQLDPKTHKAYCWKAYAVANLIRLGQLPSSWESAGLAAAAVAGYLNNQCLLEYKMKIEYPVIRYKIIENESDLGSEISSMMNKTHTTLLLRKGQYKIALERGEVTTKSVQIIGIEENVEIHSPLGVALVRLESSGFKIENKIDVFFENVTFPTQTGQIFVGPNINAVFYRCRFSNGKKGCEDFPVCKGGEGCINPNPSECKTLSLENEKLNAPQASGIVGHPGVCAQGGGKVLIDSCILDRCGGGGTLSVNGSLLLIRNSSIRNMRQMGVEARNTGETIAENCSICNNQTHGVAIGPIGKGQVKNCVIENNKCEGIWCGGILYMDDSSKVQTTTSDCESSCIIASNLIYQNAKSGISLDGGSCYISGNKIFENWLWGMMVKSRSSAHICYNDIFENKCGGIRIGVNYSAPVIIDGNTIRDHTGPGIHTENVPEELMPRLIQGSMVELMKTEGMLDDECTMFSIPPIITSRNLFENNNKGQQHPQEIHQLIETCCFCHKASLHLQRCAKCRKAPYCSKECQREHWTRHKGICRLIMKHFTVDVLMSETTPWDKFLFPEMPANTCIRGRNAPLPGLGEGQPPDKTGHKKFIIKIQSGTEYTRYDPNKQMRLYDQTQTLDVFFKHQGIFNLVHECGVLGATKFTSKKIFCWASFKDSGKVLSIYTENLAPFQTW